MYVYSALRHMVCRQKYYKGPKANAETETALIYGSLKTELDKKSWTLSHPDCTSGHDVLN